MLGGLADAALSYLHSIACGQNHIDQSGRAHWKDFDLTVKATSVVQTIRLDTFMSLAQITTIDYLKIDAEGFDLRVVKSAGDRLKDIKKLTLEVDIAPERLYCGAPTHDEVLDFMLTNGFQLEACELQNSDRQENLTFRRVPWPRRQEQQGDA